jgi:hypothetical protein
MSTSACKAKSQTATVDPDAKKNVAVDDCKQWSAHAVDVILREWKSAASQCPEAAQTALAAKLDGERPSIERGANDVCSRHLGEAYVTKDGLCYAAATTVDGLTACKLAPMTNPDDSDLKGALDSIRHTCATKGKLPATGVGL